MRSTADPIVPPRLPLSSLNNCTAKIIPTSSASYTVCTWSLPRLNLLRQLGIVASTCLDSLFPFRSLKTALSGSCWALGVLTLCMDTSFLSIPQFESPKTQKAILQSPTTSTLAHAPPKISAALSSNELVACMFGMLRRRESFSSRNLGDVIPQAPARNR
jgi:hypothetical protein